jgi:hypothetical protein
MRPLRKRHYTSSILKEVIVIEAAADKDIVSETVEEASVAAK